VDFTSVLVTRLAVIRLAETQGIYRASMSWVFGSGYWEDPNLINRVNALRTTMDVFTTDYYRYADDSMDNYYSNLQNQTQNVINEAEQLYEYAVSRLNATATDPLSIDPQTWFNTYSASINNSYTTFEFLSNTIKTSNYVDLKTKSDGTLAVVIIGFVVEVVAAVQLFLLAYPILRFFCKTMNYSSKSSEKKTSTRKSKEVSLRDEENPAENNWQVTSTTTQKASSNNEKFEEKTEHSLSSSSSSPPAQMDKDQELEDSDWIVSSNSNIVLPVFVDSNEKST